MSFSERLGRFVLRHRLIHLIGVVAVTIFFAAMIPRVKVESLLIDLFPEDHEFIETYKEYQDVFGGANAVILDIEVKEGDIFAPAALDKIRQLTKELELLPGVNNYQVLSLAQRKVKNITVDSTAGFQAVPLMWPEVPKTPEEVENLKRLVHASGRVHGSLVSYDDKAALVVAGFFEARPDAEPGSEEAKKGLNVKEVYSKLNDLAGTIRDGNTDVHIIGRPVMLGFILEHYSQLVYLFIATILSMILILAVNFRDLRGVLIPMLTAVMSAVWAIGLLGLLDFNFDPLILVVPFIISARALSHSVQLIERFNEEYAETRDTRESAVRTFSGLLEPGFVGIVADALGMAAVWFTPIPLMQKLAVMGGWWGMSIIFTDMIFNPVLLSYLPPPGKKAIAAARETRISRFLGNVGRMCMGRHRWTVLAGTAVLLVGGFLLARNVSIGDKYPGSPMLWPSSEYNQDTEAIGRKFNNTDVINVIVEGDGWNAIKYPEVLGKMYGLQREMASLPEVGGTSSIADYIPPLIRAMHGGDPRWELVPTEAREAGFFLEMIYGASEPGDLSRFITPDSRHANIAIYLKDHKGETLRKVVETLRNYVDQNPMEHAKFRLAGGYGGLLASVNEVVMSTEALVTGLAFLSVFLLCAIFYRSVLAGIFFMLPLVLSNYLTYALMGLRGIGLDVNALPVVSLGVGLGVDYGLYVASRVMEEYKIRKDLQASIVIAMSTSGKAVLLTAATMVAGVVFWTFSFLRFQADMGLLLVFWMTMSMVGSLLLLPTLIWMFKPRFVIGSAKRG